MSNSEQLGRAAQLGRLAAEKRAWSLSPGWRRTLTGAGIGSVLGYLTDVASDYDLPQEYQEEDSPWDGALAGGLAGGGLGYGYHRLRNAFKIPVDAKDRPSSTDFNAEDLGSVLPENYREDAQRHAKKYRESIQENLKDYDKPIEIETSPGAKPFLQDISDKAIDRKVRVREIPPDEMTNLGGLGKATAQYELGPFGMERISVPPDRWGLSHELTHASQDFPAIGSRESFFRPSHKKHIEEIISGDHGMGPHSQKVKQIADYLANPLEEEAYLADIKRNYFKHTGKHVKNPEDAGEAIKWVQDVLREPYPGADASFVKRKKELKESVYGDGSGRLGIPLLDTLLQDDGQTPKQKFDAAKRDVENLSGGRKRPPLTIPTRRESKARKLWIEALKRKMPGLVQNNTRMPGMSQV